MLYFANDTTVHLSDPNACETIDIMHAELNKLYDWIRVNIIIIVMQNALPIKADIVY